MCTVTGIMFVTYCHTGWDFSRSSNLSPICLDDTQANGVYAVAKDAAGEEYC